MTIVSISMTDDSITSLEKIQNYLDLAGRSEAVRASIKIAEAEIEEMGKKLDGDVEGVLIVVHSTHGDRWLSVLQSRFDAIIRTQLHSHLQNKKCLEVMIVSGNSDALEEMMIAIHNTGKPDYVKFVRSR